MAAVASPTPIANYYDGFARQVPPRQLTRTQPVRPNLRRRSPLSLISSTRDAPISRQHSTGDSSDDESSAPFLSAEAAELLGVRGPKAGEFQIARVTNIVKNTFEYSAGSPASRNNILPNQALSLERKGLLNGTEYASPRIVRLSPGSGGSNTLRRTASTSSIHGQSPIGSVGRRTAITPLSRPRSAQKGLVVPTLVDPASDTHFLLDDANMQKPPGLVAFQEVAQEAAVSAGNYTTNRTRVEDGLHSSMRLKRPTGRFLSQRPARRVPIRRQSDENQNIGQDGNVIPVDDEPNIVGSTAEASPKEAPSSIPEVHREAVISSQPRSSSNSGSHISTISPNHGTEKPDPPRPSPPSASNISNNSSGKRVVPIFNFKVPPLPSLPSRYDQENQEPPPTFKRNKIDGLDLLNRPHKVSLLGEEMIMGTTPATVSPQRPALAPRSHNTPHRPAPPPPKMTVLETVTAPAGAASVSQNRKKGYRISINGKSFTRLDCIGRGGSAKVYRVMAENFKMFALKRVSLAEADEMAIRGFKGEIDLLRKLENVDRVVRLYDYEVNDDRQVLSVLMEIGEVDFFRVLNTRLNAEHAKFDITFTRYFWKEMVECVQAVHEHDIVHSDLKPANFILLNNSLKLIDFGIANAIQDDTVNVHRDTQIGTPNFMSPEALLDSNASSGIPSSAGKLMKVGKPSDVWSLGCILYQMVYGKAPFAHIANQMSRIMAITNPNHAIEFRSHGIGNVPVPPGLIRTLQRCLDRNLARRPTPKELLADDDPFLNPDVAASGTVAISRDLVATIQRNVAHHIQNRGMLSEAELAKWAELTFASIKKTADEGRV